MIERDYDPAPPTPEEWLEALEIEGLAPEATKAGARCRDGNPGDHCPQKGTTVNVNDFYQTESRWLKAGDLHGRKVRVVIDKTEIVEFKDGSKKLAVLFQGKEKGLVLNKTNAQIIAEQYGPDSEQWGGKGIAIYPTTTDFGGERVDCIRVEQHVPEADPDDEIPF